MNPPPDGYTVRPATRDDIDAIAALVQAVDRHDDGIVEPVRGHIEDDWANPLFDAEQDTLLVTQATGDVAAYGTAWGIEPSASVEAWISIHPDHRDRGLGTWLVRWAEARSRRYLAGLGTSTLLRPVVSASGAGGAFLEGLGYRHVRTFWHMERRLDGRERPGPDPDGVMIRPYRDGDGPALHRVLESSFEDHFGFEPMPYDAWEAANLRAPSTELDLVLLAERGGEPVAGLTTAFEEEESWVVELGVLEAHRGIGIGLALLWRVFAELAARGQTIVKLSVDGQNQTGATRLYERVGMRAGRSWHFYEKRIDAD
ncbi:MAG TPA: GNAT family N-acetyltransferase [Actinomycetota bacterium]|nr:GNAT family N-acetyltransferase [Actinomycetota bacterium]